MKNNENTGGEDLGTQPTSEESEPEKSKHDELYRSPEIGGPKGLEPTRYGDWERRGRCIDF